jgi:hypothetical protein
LQLAALLECLLKGTSHVEGVLRELVTSALKQLGEALDGVLELHELAGLAGENFGHEEGLRQEALDLTGTRHGELVLFGEIVHTENGNNVLEGSVVLKKLLHTTSGVVVDLADNGWVKHAGGGVEGVDGGVNAKFGEGTGQHSSSVQVSEGGGGRGIGQIVSGHVDGLHGGDGAGLGGGDALLKGTQIGGEGRLVTHSGGDTAEQGGHLGAGLGESEDVVDEEQHILVFLVSEVFGDGETGKADTGAGTWGLVHLTVHKGGLGAGAVNLDDARVDHLVVEIVTLTGAFADTSEDGETTVLFGDVVNQLHDEHSLADTSTAEKTNLASLSVWTQEVNNFDAYIIIN